VAAECLFYLTALLGRETVDRKPNPRIQEALPYYHRFWKTYGADSLYAAKVAVAGIPAMRKAGKIEEAMKRLQSVISEIAKTPDLPGLEEAIGSYTDEYLKDHSVRELQEHYLSGHGSPAQKALFRIAVIEAYENRPSGSLSQKDQDYAKAVIKTLFRELQQDFKLKDLNRFVLIKVGDHFRLEEKKPEIARRYYQEALNRRGQSRLFQAIMGLAEVNAEGTAEQKQKALPLLKRVANDSGDLADREKALVLIASLYFDLKDYEKAITTAKAYLNQKKFRRHRIECQLVLGQAYEASGEIDKALAAYLRIWAGSSKPSHLKHQATYHWMELLWKRNKKTGTKSDRQIAYERGYDFIKMTGQAIKKGSPQEKAQWQKIADLVKTYEASPDTKQIGE